MDPSGFTARHPGEIPRRGYRIEWFSGDHGPRHVRVYDAKERFLGRLDIDQRRGMEGWLPSKKSIKLGICFSGIGLSPLREVFIVQRRTS